MVENKEIKTLYLNIKKIFQALQALCSLSQLFISAIEINHPQRIAWLYLQILKFEFHIISHVIKYYFAFDFFQHVKNIFKIFSSEIAPKQVLAPKLLQSPPSVQDIVIAKKSRNKHCKPLFVSYLYTSVCLKTFLELAELDL